MDSEVSVKVLSAVSELEGVRAFWESSSGDRDTDVEVFLEFFATNTESLSPCVIAAYRGGNPEALLVGRIDAIRFPFRIGYWRIKGPRVRMLSFLIGAQRGDTSPAMSETLLRQAMHSVESGGADAIRLQYVPVDSALFRLGRSLPGFLGRDRLIAPVPHWFMDLPATYDEFLQGMSGDYRRKLKQKARRLIADHGAIEQRCFKTPEELGEMLREVEAIAAKSYQRKIGAGFHDTELTRKMLEFQAKRGWLLGYFLYVRAVPIAYWMGSLYKDTFSSDYIGYDPDFAEYSPGTELEARVIQDLCAKGAKRIDLGLGDYRWKQRLGTFLRQDTDLYIFPRTIRGVALNSIHTTTLLVNQSLKEILQKFGALGKIKAAWSGKGRTTPKGSIQEHSAPQEGV
jgi:hypothetical protein